MGTCIRCCLVVVLLCVLFSRGISEAYRDLPEDNLAYPLLITTGSKTSSGCYLNDGKSIFIVTARHVFYPPDSGRTFKRYVTCLSYSADSLDTNANHLVLDLVTLGDSGDFKVHDLEDIAVIRIATLDGRELKFLPGADMTSRSKSGIVSVSLKFIKTFDQVLVSNEVFLFGYPSALGLKGLPQLDKKKPLLRKGILAGKNDTLRTLILDLPVYHGNSGGLILEVETEGFERKYRVIGVATQYVPSVVAVNAKEGVLVNSGYSVATSMNPVLELVALFSE